VQTRSASFPGQHVPHEGGARDRSRDVLPHGVFHPVREAVRSPLFFSNLSSSINEYRRLNHPGSPSPFFPSRPRSTDSALTLSSPSSPVCQQRRRRTPTRSPSLPVPICSSLVLFSPLPCSFSDGQTITQTLVFLHAHFSIGCITTPKDFCVSGTASEKLFGVAEGLWEPDLVRSHPLFSSFPSYTTFHTSSSR
jgi:hypothetical protein